ncbi:MAG: amino acid--tRNA ligase-related protein, partial [Chlamydiia bacterium]
MSAESTKSGKVALIRKRAELLHRARAFFDERGLIEVDVPLLVQGAPLDAHIDLFEVLTQKGHRYLHSSPEHGMKRLLAAGCPDCYQMSHVFRLGEQSSRHNPEFLMAEWYRRGWSLEQLMEETVALFRLFLGPCEVRYSGYWDLLTAQVGADLSQATTADLLMICKQKNIELGSSASTWDRTALIQLLFATTVEPTLGQETLDLVIDWPEDQAAHSRKILRDGRWVAQRFEAYY